MNWFSENGGTILVLAAITIAALFALRAVHRNRKNGTFSCGNCSSACPMHGTCHRPEKKMGEEK